MPRPLRQNAEPDEFDRAVAEGLAALEKPKKRLPQAPEKKMPSVETADETVKQIDVAANLEYERALYRNYVHAVLQPSIFRAEEVMGKSGRQLWHDKIELEATLGNLPRIPLMPRTMVLQSGTNESTRNFGRFLNGELCAFSIPSLPYKNGVTPVNKDGIVVYPHETDRTLTAVMVHGVGGDVKKNAGLANGAAVTAAHDIARLQRLRLPQILNRVNETVLDLEKQMNHSAPAIAIAAARLDMGKKNHGYHLEVSTAGNIHVFIIGKNGEVRSMPLQTVAETIKRKSSKHELERLVLAANGNMASKKKAAAKLAMMDKGLSAKDQIKIIQHLANQQNSTPEAIGKSLFMGAGLQDDIFKPETEVYDTEPGEIIVMASDAFMACWSQNESFQDRSLAGQIQKGLVKGQSLSRTCEDLLKTARTRQQKKLVDDEPLSLIAFEVPEG